MSPLVSVVMPVRNGGAWLAEAADSILAQSCRDLELLVVDDHSDDGAVGVLPRQDARLAVIQNAGRGVSDAFNTGLAHSRGRYVARMDADDIALPHRLETQLAYLAAHDDVAICGGCVELFAADGLAGGNRRYQSWLNACRTPAAIRREIFIESPIPNPTALFRRQAIEALGGYGDPSWPEDYDLFLRADAAGMRMGKPDEIVLRWREHEGRLTRTDSRYDREAFFAAKLHFLAVHRLPSDQPLLIWGAGPTGRLVHDLLASGGRPVRGFLEVHPRRIGGEKRGLPVYSLERLRQEAGTFVLAAVGSSGARVKIRRYLDELGRKEGEDYLFVA
jgi:glycosyltransferase involved in cell wall biosynthesis